MNSACIISVSGTSELASFLDGASPAKGRHGEQPSARNGRINVAIFIVAILEKVSDIP
jgi:hypothetical protein